MDSYIWIIFHHPSRAAYNTDLGVLYDLTMIYDKASFVLKWYIYYKQIDPHINECLALKAKFRETFKLDATHQ